jgi:hypothetical protein
MEVDVEIRFEERSFFLYDSFSKVSSSSMADDLVRLRRPVEGGASEVDPRRAFLVVVGAPAGKSSGLRFFIAEAGGSSLVSIFFPGVLRLVDREERRLVIGPGSSRSIPRLRLLERVTRFLGGEAGTSAAAADRVTRFEEA